MLAKKPSERPADAAQLVREVERLLRGETSDFELHHVREAMRQVTFGNRCFVGNWQVMLHRFGRLCLTLNV